MTKQLFEPRHVYAFSLGHQARKCCYRDYLWHHCSYRPPLQLEYYQHMGERGFTVVHLQHSIFTSLYKLALQAEDSINVFTPSFCLKEATVSFDMSYQISSIKVINLIIEGARLMLHHGSGSISSPGVSSSSSGARAGQRRGKPLLQGEISSWRGGKNSGCVGVLILRQHCCLSI